MLNLRNLSFLFYVIIALIVSYLPIIHWPFSWWTSFFQEFSKALTLLLTGGSVENITLSLRGIGTSTLEGGYPWLTAVGGYFGLTVSGVLIYIMSDKIPKRYAVLEALLLAALIIMSMYFWVRDFVSVFILLLILLFIFFTIKLHHRGLIKFTIKFIGIYMILESLRVPLNLLDGRIDLKMMPMMQSNAFLGYSLIIIWCLLSLFALYWIWRWHKPPELDQKKIFSNYLPKLMGLGSKS